VCAYTQRLLSEEDAVIPPERLHVIHNGVNPALYQPDAEQRAAIRSELDYGEGHVVFGTAARLSRDKGHRFILDAVASIREQVPQMRVLFLGEGPLRPVLEGQTADLGLEDVVRFAGFQRDMVRWVHAFDVGVQPSIDVDTSSFSVKEQMACGIPVIVSDYGGLPEIVAHRAEGLVCPAGDADALAEAMHALAGDTGLRRRLGEAGRARVVREFSLDAFTEGTVSVYRRALAGGSRPG
jgi:glycosyltransferase involved in cell wall biosynthesis